MGQNLLDITHGDFNAELRTTERGGLSLRLSVQSTSIHGGQTMTMDLAENDARAMKDVLETYLNSRQTKFEVGDIVYEPKHYKRAAEVIHILEDRITYGAPYRIRFIDQDPRQPDTDYFAAEDLVLVQKKEGRKDV